MKLLNIFKKNKKDDADLDLMASDFTHLNSEDTETLSTNKVHDGLIRLSNPSAGSMTSTKTNSAIFERQLPIIGNMDVKSQYKIIVSVGVLGALLLTASSFLYNTNINYKSQTKELILSLSNINRDIQNITPKALQGDDFYFKELMERKENLNSLLSKLSSSLNDFGIKNGDVLYTQYFVENKKIIDEVNKNIDSLNEQKTILKNTTEFLKKFDAENKKMIDSVDRLSYLAYQNDSNAVELSNLNSIILNIQILQQQLIKTSSASVFDVGVLSVMKESKIKIQKAIEDLYNGNSSLGIRGMSDKVSLVVYASLANRWTKVSNDLDKVINSFDKITSSQKISQESFSKIDTSSKLLEDFSKEIDKTTSLMTMVSIVLLVFGALISVIALLSIIYLYILEKNKLAAIDKANAFQSQQAILRLLDELAPISGGDLTRELTVSEDLTGAIADSINMTVSDLAKLVQKIKETSSYISTKTIDATSISESMLKESEKQAFEIKNTSENVLSISKAVNEISIKTAESAKVAINSVEVSSKGAESVGLSIGAMDIIKTNIYDTTLLMKKLLDSSRQISEIIELLSDISEETSVLALNATVQASKAGEAGKGFTIVANSVQDLASKASDATRKVGALIGTIQTDIQAVNSSLLKTTDEVNNGTNLSKDAGEALSEVTRVSDTLSAIIKAISEETKQYAENANKLSNNIRGMLAISEKTQDDTQKTNDAVKEISMLTEELSIAVERFKVE